MACGGGSAIEERLDGRLDEEVADPRDASCGVPPTRHVEMVDQQASDEERHCLGARGSYFPGR